MMQTEFEIIVAKLIDAGVDPDTIVMGKTYYLNLLDMCNRRMGPQVSTNRRKNEQVVGVEYMTICGLNLRVVYDPTTLPDTICIYKHKNVEVVPDEDEH